MNQFLPLRRFVPALCHTPALDELCQLYGQLCDLILLDTDDAVKGKKIAWWGDELEKLFTSEPTHPLLQSLQRHISNFGWQKSSFDSLNEALHQACMHPGFADPKALMQHAENFTGQFFVLVGQALGLRHQAIQKLGAAIYIWEVVLAMGRDVRAGIVNVPADLLSEYALEANELCTLKSPQDLPIICSKITALAEAPYLAAKTELKGQNAAPLLAWAALVRQRVSLTAESKYPVINGAIYATHLSIYWLRLKWWLTKEFV